MQWVAGFKFSVSHPSPLWCGSGWWLLGLGFAPPRPLWCGWWGLGFRCIDMNGFRVECQQLGTARTETVARPGECRRIGHATKLHSLQSHNTHEDPRFGGPIPVTVGTFETTVRPLRGFRALPLGGGGGYHGGGGGGGVPTRDTRPYIHLSIYIYTHTCTHKYVQHKHTEIN